LLANLTYLPACKPANKPDGVGASLVQNRDFDQTPFIIGFIYVLPQSKERQSLRLV
jgi:hypothetical protein